MVIQRHLVRTGDGWRWAVYCALMLGCLGIGIGQARAQEDLADKGVAHLEAVEAALKRSIDRCRPSVASIFIVDQQMVARASIRDPRDLRPGRLESTEFQAASFGSGIVIREEGLIATCYHVVKEAAHASSGLDIIVELHDGTSLPAMVYAADPRSDLAVLKLRNTQPLRLVPMTIGDGSKLFAGQFVLALGNPFGVASPDGATSASWGIISNIRRQPARVAVGNPEEAITIQGRTLVQTDARLNMGSSGSALVNLRGELVGIGMALSAAVGFEAPGGFAQPTDALTRRILDTLAEGREMEYGFIGIQFSPTSRGPQVAREGGRLEGAIVQSVEMPSARLAGLEPNDLIIEVNGERIRDQHDLVLLVGSLPAGSKLRTKVLRGTAEKELTIPLGKFPLREEGIATVKRPIWNGIRVDYLSTLVSPGSMRFGDVPDLPTYGVAIREVVPDSSAHEKGIQPRQVIREVNGQKIYDPDQFDAVVAKATGPVHIKLDGGVEQVFDSSTGKTPKP